jgi:hypothetical protein
MTDRISVRLDAAFVLAVTGAALIVPWLALFVGAAFLMGNAMLIDRRTPP